MYDVKNKHAIYSNLWTFLHEFKLGHNATVATNTFVVWKVKTQLNRVQDQDCKEPLVARNHKLQETLGWRLKTVNSVAVLQVIETNPVSSTQRVSAEVCIIVSFSEIFCLADGSLTLILKVFSFLVISQVILLFFWEELKPLHIYISSSSSSCRAASTDIPDPLSPLLPIIHRLRQVFRVTSCVLT